MLTAHLITATELHEREVRLAERGLFPELIRRLLIASDPSVRWIHFRAHEGTAIGGWDGRIEHAHGASPYVPAGGSRWELGTNQDALTKLKADFEKRNQTPEANADQLTLVFVVIRRRKDKEKWASEFAAVSSYRDVRILDGDDLETWLHQHPAIHVWLSVQLGKYVEGLIDVESWWRDWAAQTTPPMQADWLLSGREAARARLTSWLSEARITGRTQSIFASTAEEARVFITACLLQLPDDLRTVWLARAAVVKSESLWDRVIQSPTPLLLLPSFASADFNALCAAANQRGHHVLLSRPIADAGKTDSSVPPLNREEMQAALVAAGFSRLDAAEKANLARRSFTAFHRTLLTDKSLQQPWWQQAEVAQQLLPLLLLGRWQADAAGDQQLVEHLTGEKYEVVEQRLLGWQQRPATPVRRILNEWFILDLADVWEQTALWVTSALLARFSEVVQHVLSLPLARFNLPPGERRFAGLRGLYDDYSSTLRTGLTMSLALLSTHVPPVSEAQRVPAWVSHQVRSLLANALSEPTGHVLASLNTHLPALAEAAPQVFLDIILAELRNPQTTLLRLFEEEEALTHRTAHHTGLLWALESLAWPSEHLADATLALAGLARLDPGGQLANRPIQSLRTIFLGWRPQTTASVEARLAALDRLRLIEPAVSWSLLRLLLPTHSAVSIGSHLPTFHWRDWEVNPDRKPPLTEYFFFVEHLTERVLTDVGTDSKRWSELIDTLPELLNQVPAELRERLFSQLLQLAALPIPTADRYTLLKELREFLNRHRSIPDADWAWNEQELAPVASLYQQLQPTSPIERSAWLFEQWPQLPEGIQLRRHEESMALIEQRQEQALGELFREEGTVALEQLLPLVPSAFWLGYASGRSKHFTTSNKLEFFQQYAATADERHAQFGKGIAASLTRVLGDAEAAIAARTQKVHWQPAQMAEWLVTMPMTGATWQLAQELEVAEPFWQLAHDYVPDEAEVPEAIRHFLDYHRPAAAAHLLFGLQRHDGQRLPSELVLATLKALFAAQAEAGQPMIRRYELEVLLDELECVPDDKRQQALELAFLFSPAISLQNPRLLNNELGRNPAFFVELLGALYKPDDGLASVVENLDEKQRRYKLAVAERAWSILHNWETVPGTQPDGTLDEDWLMSWLMHARHLATEQGLTTGLDVQLGLLLSHAPPAADGVWPPLAVRNILETEAHNDTLLRHVYSGRYNIHGRTHIVDGGQREQQIAADYAAWAQQLQVQYPVTARLLRELRDDFVSQANAEQQRAERADQFGL